MTYKIAKSILLLDYFVKVVTLKTNVNKTKPYDINIIRDKIVQVVQRNSLESLLLSLFYTRLAHC